MNMFWLSVITGLVASLAPGPSFLYVFNLSLLSESIYAPLIGMWIGSLLCGVLALFGVSILLLKFHVALEIIKLIGSVMLIYLGVQKFITKSKSVEPKSNTKKYLIEGTLVTVSNPKIFLYYAIILPQFIKSRDHIFAEFLLLIATQLILKGIALVLWLWACLALSKKIVIGKYVNKINLAFGAIFIVVGIIMGSLSIAGI